MSNLEESLVRSIYIKRRLLLIPLVVLVIIISINVYFNVKLNKQNDTINELIKDNGIMTNSIGSLKEEIQSKNKTIDEKSEAIREQDVKIKELEKRLKEVRNQSNSATRGVVYSVPNTDSSFKSYMDLKAITSKSSPQYKFINRNRDGLSIDKLGCYRLNGDYLVALGSAYGNIGDRFKVKFSNGKSINVVKTDVKADIHTDSSNRYHLGDGSVIEFLVDRNNLHKDIRIHGGLHGVDGFEGSVVSIVGI